LELRGGLEPVIGYDWLGAPPFPSAEDIDDLLVALRH